MRRRGVTAVIQAGASEFQPAGTAEIGGKPVSIQARWLHNSQPMVFAARRVEIVDGNQGWEKAVLECWERGATIATQTLERNHPDEFFDETYAVPVALTQGKDRVTVRFQAKPGNTAGGVFGLRVLKAAPAR